MEGVVKPSRDRPEKRGEGGWGGGGGGWGGGGGGWVWDEGRGVGSSGGFACWPLRLAMGRLGRIEAVNVPGAGKQLGSG